MPNFEQALLSFGQLIALFDAQGNLVWTWFADPLNQSLGQLPANRAFLGKLIRCLLDRDPDAGDKDFITDYAWEPLNLADEIAAGFVWSKTGSDLKIGLGSKASFAISGKDLDLSVLAHLIRVHNSTVDPDISHIQVSGSFPVPDFLDSASVEADITIPSPVNVSLHVKDKRPQERDVSLTANPSALPWDAARIALFVLEAWIHKQASGAGDNFYTRSDKHLFPMFGEPESTIKAFPLFGASNMGTTPNFDLWRNSVLTTSGDAAGALLFLWHLRALLTGNESPNFFSGSIYMDLTETVASGSPPTLANSQGARNIPANKAGVWIGIDDSAAPDYKLLLELRDGHGNACPIPLAQVTGGTFSRPTISIAAIDTFLTNAISASVFPITLSPGHQIAAPVKNGSKWTITLFSETPPPTGIPGFDGTFKVQLVLEEGKQIYFHVSLPFFDLPLPPGADPAALSPTALVATLVQWVLSSVPASPGNPLAPIAKGIGDFVKDALVTHTADPLKLLPIIIGVLGSLQKNGNEIDLGPLVVSVSGSVIKPGLQIGPLTPDDLASLPLSIGKLGAQLNLDVSKPTQPLSGFTLSMTDLRVGTSGGFSGVVGSLIPDLKQAPGFNLQLSWNAPSSITVTGGGKIPVQQTLGPLSVSALVVDLTKTSLSIGIDLTFQLAVITVTAYELGVQIPFDGSAPTPFLHGLGLEFDGGGITLAGMFAEVKQPDNTVDYVGGAVVSVEDWFELSAIGGYTQLPDKSASLFIFASLVAPLGGTPFFFVTGIAGGFGFNRMLPDVNLMANHPFFKVMSGELPLSSDSADSLATLSAQFVAKKDEYWIAAGIQFISFGFINGKVIVAVAFGHDFSFNLLGLASFGISPIAYFEIAILLTADAEHFKLKASVSANSYLISPDIFSLRGDFALAVWYGGPHAGDFMLSIGGYHPYFKKPDYYDSLERVSVKATVYNFVHVSIECFFACTPQALMAGASVSLWAEFAGISAGLDVYVDVFIQWDPFFIMARLGISLWFEFCGRHEIGVDLEVHTPPFGGVAHISLFIVSFDVSFGDQLAAPPPPPLAEFISNEINVPSTGTSVAKAALFNSDASAGLARVDLLTGRAQKDSASASSKQEGVDTPIAVNSEFTFSVRSHLPMSEANPHAAISAAPLSAGADPTAQISGKLNVPLCGKSGLTSALSVTAKAADHSLRDRSVDLFPAANFGKQLPSVQADGARQSVANIPTDQPSVALTDGILFNYTVQQPAMPALTENREEFSEPNQEYPLPLDWPRPARRVYRGPKSAFQYALATAATKLPAKTVTPTRRTVALQQILSTPKTPPRITTLTADMQRATLMPKSTTVAQPPAGAPIVAPPASPARRPELFAVSLRVTPPHAAAPIVRPKLTIPLRPSDLTHEVFSPAISVLKPTTNISPVATTLVTPVKPVVVPPVVPPATTSPSVTLRPDLAASVLRTPISAVVLPKTTSPAGGPPATTPPSTTPPTMPPPSTTGGTSGTQPPSTKTSVTLPTGKAAILDFSVGDLSRGTLTFAGQQTVRAIALSDFMEPLLDVEVQGAHTINLPPRAGCAALLAEGPVVAAGNSGVERDTVLLALSPTVFAAHRCVVETKTPPSYSAQPLDSVPGSQILSSVVNFRLSFPAATDSSSLTLIIVPVTANPGPAADQFRWRSSGAVLSALTSVVTPDHAAFVMSVGAKTAWSLDLDLGTDWRLAGAIISPRAATDVVAALQASSDWDLIDDRIIQPASPVTSTITLEAFYE